jgi:hypothetical protein
MCEGVGWSYFDIQLLVNLVLNRKTVAIPTKAAGNIMAGLVSISSNHVLLGNVSGSGYLGEFCVVSVCGKKYFVNAVFCEKFDLKWYHNTHARVHTLMVPARMWP